MSMPVLDTIRELEAMSKRLMVMATDAEPNIGRVLRQQAGNLDHTCRTLSQAANALGLEAPASAIAQEFHEILAEQDC